MEITSPGLNDGFEEIISQAQSPSREYGKMLGSFGETIVHNILDMAKIAHEVTSYKAPLDFIVMGKWGVECKATAFNQAERINIQNRNGHTVKDKLKLCAELDLVPALLVVYVDTSEERFYLLWRDRFKSYLIRSLWSARTLLAVWKSDSELRSLEARIRAIEEIPEY